MAALSISTIIGAIGVAASVAGTGVAMYGAAQQNSAQRKAEELRKNQMELDAMRRQREIIRQGQLARATALANATSQGAQEGSGLSGGYGQISGRTNTNFAGVQDNLEIGRNIFNANAEASQYATVASIGQGMSTLGGSLVKNAETIGKVGNWLLGYEPYARRTA